MHEEEEAGCIVATIQGGAQVDCVLTSLPDRWQLQRYNFSKFLNLNIYGGPSQCRVLAIIRHHARG